jgi:hypothetical protein
MQPSKNLPVFKLKIDETDTGVDYVALVDHPAIERNWVAFAKDKSRFQVSSELKRIVTGPLMIADLPIYRRSKEMGEYYAVFDAETIQAIVQRYFKNKYTDNVNINHESDKVVDGVFMFESFIIDRERGIKPPKGFDGVTDGSWFGSFKVDNEDVWNEFIQTGELRGFSIEGDFLHEQVDNKPKSELEQLIEILEQIKP